MKKLLLLFPLIFFILSFYLLHTSFATSGACSYHGGVNCSAGADWDGSVICNDGWRDSSVKYRDMDMCDNDSTDPFIKYVFNIFFLLHWS